MRSDADKSGNRHTGATSPRKAANASPKGAPKAKSVKGGASGSQKF